MESRIQRPIRSPCAFQSFAQRDTIVTFEAEFAVEGLCRDVFPFDLKFQCCDGHFPASLCQEMQSLGTQTETPVAVNDVQVGDYCLAAAKLQVVAEREYHVTHVFLSHTNQPYPTDRPIPQKDIKTCFDFASPKSYTVKFIVFPSEAENSLKINRTGLNERRFSLPLHHVFISYSKGFRAVQLTMVFPEMRASAEFYEETNNGDHEKADLGIHEL
jgi:hypothetical protein